MRQVIAVQAVLAALLAGACDNDAAEGEPVTPAAEEAEAPKVEGAGTEAVAWDTNQDRRVDPAEFQAGAKARYWSRWNTDDSDGLSPEEFAAGLHRSWDADGDGVISESEWKERAAPWLEARGLDAGHAGWSTDEAEGVSAAELRQGFEDEEGGILGDWDEDTSGELQDVEWGRGWFEAWDADKSGYLDDDELGYWQ